MGSLKFFTLTKTFPNYVLLEYVLYRDWLQLEKIFTLYKCSTQQYPIEEGRFL